ncbi:MAG TPA: hypothetical protein VNL71_02855, partial [Chloroflexota bacterium]|nr:hypothetical protein [Chloroflexota bacterium]
KKKSPLVPLPAIDKMAYLLTCETADSYPTGEATTGIRGWVRSTNIGIMAKRAGCSPATMAKAVNHCVAVNLLTREDKTDPGTGHHIVALGVVRKPGFHELFPASEERKKDAERKRCPECGSDDLHTTIVKRHTCRDCGTVTLEDPGQQDTEDTPAPLSKFQRKRPGKSDEWQIAEDDGQAVAATSHPQKLSIVNKRCVDTYATPQATESHPRNPVVAPEGGTSPNDVGVAGTSPRASALTTPPDPFAHARPGAGIAAYSWAEGGAP